MEWNTKKDLHMLYSRVSLRMTLSDREWPSKIFTDMTYRVACLQQQSFSSSYVTLKNIVTFKSRLGVTQSRWK